MKDIVLTVNMKTTNSHPGKEELMKIALAQGGLFTAEQAINCGFDQRNHHYYVKVGSWEQVLRGIYRFRPIESELSEYWLWYLWSEGRDKKPQAVYSHETALSMYELSDLNPSKIHVTVPKKFRKGAEIPKILYIHKYDLGETDTKTINGLRVTTPLKTLLDLIDEKRVSDEFIEQATKQALQKGYISKADIKKNEKLARYAI
jgi:predicted transcriptional regulator of viral defense system